MKENTKENTKEKTTEKQTKPKITLPVQFPEHDFILDDIRFADFLKKFGVGYRCYYCGSYEIAIIEADKFPVLTNLCSCGRIGLYYFRLMKEGNN